MFETGLSPDTVGLSSPSGETLNGIPRGVRSALGPEYVLLESIHDRGTDLIPSMR